MKVAQKNTLMNEFGCVAIQSCFQQTWDQICSTDCSSPDLLYSTVIEVYVEVQKIFKIS